MGCSCLATRRGVSLVTVSHGGGVGSAVPKSVPGQFSEDSSRGTPVVGRATTSRRDPNELAGDAWSGMAKSSHRFAAQKPSNRQAQFPPAS